MIAIMVFLHTMLVVSLGPVLAGLFQVATSGGGLKAFLAPTRAISRGLRAPGRPPLGTLAVLAGALTAALLLPLFASDAVLGFLGDGFVALLLLSGLSSAYLSVRASSVMAVAAGLWAIGTLTGSTDLAEALASWQASPASVLVFLAMALGVAPMLSAPHADANDDLTAALDAWTRSTLQLGWLAFGAMAFPLSLSVTNWPSFALALALFLLKFGLLGAGLAFVTRRWPTLPTAEIGLALALLALAAVKLGA